MKSAQTWFEEGASFNAEGKKLEALGCYDQALSLKQSSDILFHKGNILYELARFDEANDCFDQCLALDNKYMQAYRGKFKVLLALGRKEETIEWCDKAIDVDPSYRFAYNSKANALRSLGRNEEAIENYSKAISIDSNWSFPYNGMGNALSQLKKYDEAIQCYDRAIELDPTDAFPLNGKANALVSIRRYQEAKDVYDKLIPMASKNTLYLCNRGGLLSLLGRYEEALVDFKKAYEIVKTGYVDVEMTRDNINFINKLLRPVMELDELYVDTQTAIQNANQDNPVVQQMRENMKELEKSKNEVSSRMLAHYGEDHHEQSLAELGIIKGQLLANQNELKSVLKTNEGIDKSA